MMNHDHQPGALPLTIDTVPTQSTRQRPLVSHPPPNTFPSVGRNNEGVDIVFAGTSIESPVTHRAYFNEHASQHVDAMSTLEAVYTPSDIDKKDEAHALNLGSMPNGGCAWSSLHIAVMRLVVSLFGWATIQEWSDWAIWVFVQAGDSHLSLLSLSSAVSCAAAACLATAFIRRQQNWEDWRNFISMLLIWNNLPTALAIDLHEAAIVNRHWTLSHISVVSGAAMFGLAMSYFIAQNHTRHGVTLGARVSIFAAWLVSCAVFLPATLANLRLLGPRSLLAIATLVAGAPVFVVLASDSIRAADTILSVGTFVIFGVVLLSALLHECMMYLLPRLQGVLRALTSPTNEHTA